MLDVLARFTISCQGERYRPGPIVLDGSRLVRRQCAMGCGNSRGGLFKTPGMANMMQGKMRSMMNESMHVTEHNNDCTYKEVQDFMVPSSVGKPFVDAPGTFDKDMKPRKVAFLFFERMDKLKRKGDVIFIFQIAGRE